MPVTVQEVYQLVDGLWPFEHQEPWDNSGLLVGDGNAPVSRALCALDPTEEVVREAADLHCELLITHHPLMFRGTKRLIADDPESRVIALLIRHHVSHIAAHTNFDNGMPGVSDYLAKALGLFSVVTLDSGMCLGDIEEMPLDTLQYFAERALGGPIRRYGERDRIINKVAVLGGSGGDYADIARRAGADVFLTGETGYHDALNSLHQGMATLEAGHAATEWPAVRGLRRSLQEAANRLQYKIEFLESNIKPFL